MNGTRVDSIFIVRPTAAKRGAEVFQADFRTSHGIIKTTEFRIELENLPQLQSRGVDGYQLCRVYARYCIPRHVVVHFCVTAFCICSRSGELSKEEKGGKRKEESWRVGERDERKARRGSETKHPERKGRVISA